MVNQRQPEGYWGPDVRMALAEWVEAQAPAVQQASAERARRIALGERAGHAAAR